MICKKCGALLNDECRVCPICDTPTINYVKADFDTAPAPHLQPETPPQAAAPTDENPARTNSAPNTPPSRPLYAAAPMKRAASDDAPATTSQFFLYRFLFAFPVVGLFVAIYMAFSANSNLNLRNYARATLIWYAVGIGLTLVASVVLALLALSVNWMYW